MGQTSSSRMRDPSPRVRCVRISAQVSISSWPVRNTRMSPGTGWEMCACNLVGRLSGSLVGAGIDYWVSVVGWMV